MLFEKRPDSLAYHSHELHVFDIEVKWKVKKQINDSIFQPPYYSSHELTLSSVQDLLLKPEQQVDSKVTENNDDEVKVVFY